MIEELNYVDVPYLQDIIAYLPIEPDDEEDIINYINNITNVVAVNYKYEQYQFAYFGIHLLFMTYVYCTAWKIAQIEVDRYKDAIVFARPYNGRERDFKIEDADSIFVYSLMPEKDISKLFKIIELDNSQISIISDLVDTRNDMAHASGKFYILNEESFEVKVNSIFTSIKNIHRHMNCPIRNWYEKVLLSFCKGEYEGYDDPKDIIVEQMIQSFKLSINELLICNKMSIRNLISGHTEYKDKLKSFKEEIKKYCDESGYIQD